MSNTIKILIGTRNVAKITMIEKAFERFPAIEFLSLKDFQDLDDSSLVEGSDFKKNAHMKSEFYFKKTGIPTISTDQIQWLEKYPENNGFIVHIRKLANPNSPRATDDECGIWIENLVKKHGPSKGSFYYAISYTDKTGTKDFVNIQKEYILQGEKSEKSNEGYIFDRYMKDPETGEFRINQPEEVAFSKFHDFVKQEFIPKVFPQLLDKKVF